MGVPFTFGLLAGLTGVLVLVRIFWIRLPEALRRLLVGCAIAVPAVCGIGFVSKWHTSSSHVDHGLYWLCILSYIFFLVLFTRLRPQWLTTIIAVVLIVPILSASVFLPLTYYFDMPPVVTTRIGSNIVSERIPWGPGARELSGTDLTLYYQPRWLPFLRRSLLSARYYGAQCDAWAAHAVLEPDHKNVMMVCPASPVLGPDSARSVVLPLHKPLFSKFLHKKVIPSSK